MDTSITIFNSCVALRDEIAATMPWTSVHADNFDAVCEALKNAKAFVKKIDRLRLDETRKYDEYKKTVISAQKKFVDPIVRGIDRLQALADAYVTERERLRAEAEAKAEAERQRAIEAQIASEQSTTEDDPFGLSSAAEQSPVVPSIYVPEKTHADSASITMVTDISIVNPKLVPREFMIVDERKIKDFVAAKKREGYKISEIAIPGINISEHASVRAR